MGSDPGSDLPQNINFEGKNNLQQDNNTSRMPDEGRCVICGLVARNKAELDEHIEHAHRGGDFNNKSDVYSEEQKIDPFINTKE